SSPRATSRASGSAASGSGAASASAWASPGPCTRTGRSWSSARPPAPSTASPRRPSSTRWRSSPDARPWSWERTASPPSRSATRWCSSTGGASSRPAATTTCSAPAPSSRRWPAPAASPSPRPPEARGDAPRPRRRRPAAGSGARGPERPVRAARSGQGEDPLVLLVRPRVVGGPAHVLPVLVDRERGHGAPVAEEALVEGRHVGVRLGLEVLPALGLEHVDAGVDEVAVDGLLDQRDDPLPAGLDHAVGDLHVVVADGHRRRRPGLDVEVDELAEVDGREDVAVHHQQRP